MKTSKLICAAFMFAAMAISCTWEVETPESKNEGIEMTFTASWAEGGDSRTVLQSNGEDIWWSVDEKINAFYGSGFSGQFTSTNAEPAPVTTFQGVLNVLVGGLENIPAESHYFAIYPYDENNTCDGESVTLTVPHNQTGVSGKLADNFFPAVAKGITPSLAFFNVCGGVRFSVVSEGIQRVVFRSNDGSPLTGTVRVGFAEDKKPFIQAVSEAMDSIVVTVPDVGFTSGAHYFAAMLPQSHEQGISVTLYTAHQRAFKNIPKALIVKRSVFGTLDYMDNGLVWEDYDNWFGPSPDDIIEFADSRVKNHCVAAFDTNGDGELSYGEAASVSDISTAFTSKLYISFDEFRYFTGIKSIPDNWFKDRARLMSIALPPSVTSVGNGAFVGCNALEKIAVGAALLSTEKMQTIFPDAYGAVCDWRILPSGGEYSICAQAFEDCSGLSSLALPEGLTAIGSNAFLNCSGLKKLTIPNLRSWLNVSIPSADCSPFYSSGEGHLYVGEAERTSIVIPEGLSKVGAFTFYKCCGIDEVTLPQGLKTVDHHAFLGCVNLKRVYVPSLESWLDLQYADDQSTLFGDSSEGHLYINGKEVKSVQLLSGTTQIGPYAFYGCTGIEEITLPSSLREVKRDAFYRCSGLKKANIPSLLAWLAINYENQDGAPFNASGDGHLFINGTELTEPVIPEELTVFKPYVFLNCTGLKRMLLEPTTPPTVETNAFSGTQCFFIVWDECLGTYKSAWSSLAARILSESVQFEEEMVDLGLSVQWGSCNLGAQSDTGTGFYYAWGETVPKNNYNWSGYIWCGGSSGTLTKYCEQAENGKDGFVDDKTLLELNDDAAAVTLGDKWRIPTYTEWEELKNNCTWTSETVNGVAGVKITSNKSGYTNRSIFLPAAGMQNGPDLQSSGNGMYWSSMLSSQSSINATGISFSSGTYTRNDNYRYLGYSIRPVYGDLVRVSGVSLDYVKLKVGDEAQLVATVVPVNASEQSLLWSTSDATVATVTETGYVKVIRYGRAEITAKTVDGGYVAKLIVENIYSVDTPEKVDLGLSVKWASFNLGASSPEGYGDYFAWGEVSPKNEYTWINYLFRISGDSSNTVKFSKYNTYSSHGQIDNKTVLDLEDDAAAVALGGSWRMATYNEWHELRNNCTWTWTTQNGVNGRLVTGPNGNSIFLPAAGRRYDTNLDNVGSLGNYWSSSLISGNPYSANGVYFGSAFVQDFIYTYYRYYGFSVRPVSE